MKTAALVSLVGLLMRSPESAFSQQPAATKHTPLRVLSYNIHHCEGAQEKSDDSTSVGAVPKRDGHGFIVHEINSPYQSGRNVLRVLVPDNYPSGKRNSMLWVLPVEAGISEKWGDGLQEIKRLDLHNRHEVICVAPSFSQLPWYADHPSDQGVQQESYLLKSVLPFLEQAYPDAWHERAGRYLVGFSKSGYGAWSLLLRHPDIFCRAAAWDAPLEMSKPGKYGSGPIYGSDENFAKYEIASLLRRNQELLSRSATSELGPRLIHAGYGSFREQHEQIERLLNELKIPHVYRDGPERKHHWSGGWLQEMVALLKIDQ